MKWILEKSIFADNHQRLEKAAADQGHSVIEWNLDWELGDRPPRWQNEAILFHGSLGNAQNVVENFPWQPGAYCKVAAFQCSAWYCDAAQFLVHDAWRKMPLQEFVAHSNEVLDSLDIRDSFFVRPNSPLKPFAGRVLPRRELQLADFDHGFYFDDASIEVVIAPKRIIGKEWRFVVVDGELVTGSEYEANGRSEETTAVPLNVETFAAQVVSSIQAPEAVFIIDVCDCEGDLRLMELNPFSGADLYACDRAKIVESIAQLLC